MNQLIPLQETPEGVQAVMGRDLHEFLEIKEPYTDWLPRMIEYGFSAGQDFIQKNLIGQDKLGRRRETTNHIISLDMAKEISMIQRTDKGKQARQYFIECERRAKQATPAIPQTYAEALRAAADNAERAALAERQAQEAHKQLEAARPKVEYHDQFIAESDLIQFRTLANQLNIGEQKLRQALQQHGWIYDVPCERWSNKQRRKVVEHRWRCKADKKRYFQLVPQHEAPRLMGEVRQTLKITPEGAAAITRVLRKWGVLNAPALEVLS